MEETPEDGLVEEEDVEDDDDEESDEDEDDVKLVFTGAGTRLDLRCVFNSLLWFGSILIWQEATATAIECHWYRQMGTYSDGSGSSCCVAFSS